MTPMNRKETFLDGIANGTEVTLEPMTREEVYLKKIADSGGSGGDDVIFEYVQGEISCNKTPQEIAGLVGKHVNVYFYNSNSQYIATSYTINANQDQTAATIFALFITRDMYNANKYKTAFILQSAQGAASVTWKSYTLTPDE